MPISVPLDRDQGQDVVSKACQRGQSAQVQFNRPDGPAGVLPTILLAFDPDKLYIERSAGPDGPVEPAVGEQVRITFNADGKRFSLETVVKGPATYPLDAHTDADAIALDLPKQVYELRRRIDYRVPLWRMIPVNAQFEPLPVGISDGLPPPEPFHARLQNISVGGVAALVDRSVRACLAVGQHYMIDFFLPGAEETFAFAVSVRHVRRLAHSDDRIIGLKFMPGDDSESTRQAIQRIRAAVEVHRRLKS